MEKENKKYWYLFHVVECPLCGKMEKYRERKYSKKPENKEDRYFYEQVYDYCDEGYYW